MKVKKQPKTNENSETIALLTAQLARTLADYDNLTKRVERETGDIYKRVSTQLIVRLLPIVDMLESAAKHATDPGIAICLSQCKAILKEEGFEEMKIEEGSEFDPVMHEAIDMVEDPEKDGTIAEVLLSGWKYRDGSIVRVAKVKVYRKI